MVPVAGVPERALWQVVRTVEAVRERVLRQRRFLFEDVPATERKAQRIARIPGEIEVPVNISAHVLDLAQRRVGTDF